MICNCTRCKKEVDDTKDGTNYVKHLTAHAEIILCSDCCVTLVAQTGFPLFLLKDFCNHVHETPIWKSYHS